MFVKTTLDFWNAYTFLLLVLHFKIDSCYFERSESPDDSFYSMQQKMMSSFVSQKSNRYSETLALTEFLVKVFKSLFLGWKKWHDHSSESVTK